MNAVQNYPNKMDAIRGVLLETCVTLNAANVQYVVAGGWVPYLRCNGNAIRHPGTHDVDLLFNDGPEPIKLAVTRLLAAGYVPSAKHPFQLLKKLTVDHRPFVFNIDLMHPAESELEKDMFHDIMDLGVKDDYDSHITHVIKSICFPSARIIFDETLWTPFDVMGVLPDGTNVRAAIPLMDEGGLILSKCESVSGVKRGRDAFDIFLVLTGPNVRTIASRLLALSNKFDQVETQLNKLRKFIEQQPAKFNERVHLHSGGAECGDAAARVFNLLRG